MLVMKRRAGEKVIISIDGKYVATVVLTDRTARIGFEAAPNVIIHREEINDQLHGQPHKAAQKATE